MSGVSGILAGYSYAVAAYVVALACLSVALMVLRTRGWGVSFTPFDLARALLASARKGEDLGLVKAAANSAYRNVFRLRRAGAWCNEGVHVEGRALVLYGSIGLGLTTILGFISAHFGGGVVLGVLLAFEFVSGLVFASGGLILILRRVVKPNIRAVTHTDTWVLHTLILLFGVCCALSSVSALANTTPEAFHLLTLAMLGVFLLYAPYSELTFLVWKGALITLKELSELDRQDVAGTLGSGANPNGQPAQR
ncbi:MAG: hypothetical protein QW613_07255 [Thermoprotei archaeon]